MIYNSKIKYSPFLLLFISFFLYVSNLFNYVNWDLTLAGRMSYFIYGSILVFFLIRGRNNFRKTNNFSFIVICLSAIPFITIVMSYVEFNQSPIESIKVLFPHFTWLLYFMFHKYKLREKTAINLMIGFVLIIFFIGVIQQFTFPNVSFGVYSKEQLNQLSIFDKAEIRNGLYRFRFPGNSFISLIVLFYFWIKIQNHFTLKYLFVIFIALCTIYLSLTRQILATSFITLLLSVFFIRNRRTKAWTFLFIIIFILIVFSFSDVLFSQLIMQTKDDASDNIRFYTLLFYWEKITNNFFTFCFGSGFPAPQSNFGVEMLKWGKMFGFYTSDIGIVGQWFHYGLIYIVAYLYMIYKLLVKLSSDTPLYLKLFILATFFISIMIYPLTGPLYFIIWCLVLYICDLHINKSILRICK